MKHEIVFMLFAPILILLLITTYSFAGEVVLPENTLFIEDEAFLGDQSLTDLILPEGLLRIESRAFASSSLHSVSLPRSLEYFARDAFDNCSDDFMIWVYEDSEAATLCAQYGIIPRYIGKQKIGISMPTRDLLRWVQDGENMQRELEAAGYEVELQYASNDVPTQLNQIEAMTETCDVIVITAIERSSLGTALDKAAAKGIRVIAYDRLLMDNVNVDYYVTFDNYMVGTVQGAYVKDNLKLNTEEGPFYMEITAGDSGDGNARYFYQGAIDVLKPFIDSGKLIVRSGQTAFDQVATPTWRSSVAQKRASDILTACYANGEKLDAWLCSNDSTALGVLNALDNYAGDGWPIITGQDCDLANTKEIISGKQSMSVFKDTRTLAARVVTMIKQILKGEEVEVNETETYNNYVKVVPTFLCAPVYVDANNYRELLIESGYYSVEQLAGSISPRSALSQPAIQMPESFQAGMNFSFSFKTVENADSYSAAFKNDDTTIISWNSQTALPNTSLIIPGYWADSGSYTIEVTAYASGYRESRSSLVISVEPRERPAPAVSVDKSNISVQDNVRFTINTQNADELRYRVGDAFSTSRINVFEDVTDFVTTFHNTGDYVYRFAVRRGNVWSAWSEPCIIHVTEDTISEPPMITLLSELEEGRDLVFSLSGSEGATGYSFSVADENEVIYSKYKVLPENAYSIVVPGYRLGSGPYTISIYSYSSNQSSDTVHRTITILKGEKPDAPEVTPPTSIAGTSNRSVIFTIDTTGADQAAVRHYQSGYTNMVTYEDKPVVTGQTETSWEIWLNEATGRKYSFSVRINGIWSSWSTPVDIEVESLPNAKTLTYAEANPIQGTVRGQFALAFKEKLEEVSGDTIKVDIQGSGVLGSENQVLNNLLSGGNVTDLCCISPTVLSQYGCAKNGLFSLPYLFENRNHFWTFVNSSHARGFLDEPVTLGLPIRGIAYAEEGFRCFFFRNNVHNMCDLQGLRIRVSSDSIMTGMVSGFGATPVTVPFGDLYSALQEGVVDGAEQPIPNYYSNALHEVAPYLVLDRHSVSAFELILSDKSWNMLSFEERIWVQEAAAYASVICRAESETREFSTIAALEKEGVTIVDVVDKPSWHTAVQPVIDENLNGEEIAYQNILALK